MQTDGTEATFCANAFLIGAQKAGTTYLAALLDRSPDICVSEPKEPHFFTTRRAMGFDGYRRCFANPEARVLLDASTSYTMLRPLRDLDSPDAPGTLAPVPEEIHRLCPEARFIYILRDPVARAVSALRHLARDSDVPAEPVSLPQALRDNPMVALTSRYADQIERYLALFPRDRFLFLDFRELTADPEAVVARTCAFLGVAPPEPAPAEPEEKKHRAYRLTPAGRLARRIKRAAPGLVGALERHMPAALRRRLVDRVVKSADVLTFDDTEAAARLFEDDRARTADLTGLKV